MSNRSMVLGIDTSNYTTSLSLLDLETRLIREVRQVLPVPLGKAGLRQSEALFHHVRQLPALFQELLEGISPEQLAAVSAATKPRPLPDSYMPVFLAAHSYGSSLSTALKIPFYEFSHQEGHIAAGLWSIPWQCEQPFLALHLSGGTTEVLAVSPRDQGYDIQLLGGSSDLSIGQFIDRIGVQMGLAFPAGRPMEQLAAAYQGEIMEIPLSLQGSTISFSGPETFVSRQLAKGEDPGKVAKSLFLNLGKGLAKLILNHLKDHRAVLLVGGVASNQLIRQVVTETCFSHGIEIHFAEPHFCSDNSVGIGLLGVRAYAAKKPDRF